MLRPLIPLGFALALIACGRAPQKTETAQDYAARIGAPATGAAAGSASPAAAQSQMQPATAGQPAASTQPAMAPSPATPLSPASKRCNAAAATPFLNQRDTPSLRAQIVQTVDTAGGVRFLPAGSQGMIGGQPDRLNVLVDYTGALRDLRCG